MSAVEEIEAAISKLEDVRARSSRGPWVTKPVFANSPEWDETRILCAAPEGERREDYDRFIIQDGSYAVDAGSFSNADADLIVTLHHTIDAQLAILRDLHERIAGRVDEGWAPIAPAGINALALARAINGTD